MNDLNLNTEPIILCNAGTNGAHFRFGQFSIHDFSVNTGFQKVSAPEHSIFLLRSGVTTTDVIDGVRHGQNTFHTGAVAFLPAHMELKCPYVSNPYSDTVVRIPHSLLAKTAGEIQLDPRYMTFSQEATFGVTAALRNIAYRNAHTAAMPMLVEAMTMALVAKVISALTHRTAQAISKAASAKLSDHRLRQVLDCVEARLDQEVTIADMADVAALSPFHFSRAFKATTGVTPMRYVWQRRIELARSMLKDNKFTLVEVALACGYSSQSHFTTAFKESTGLTPAAWRRSA